MAPAFSPRLVLVACLLMMATITMAPAAGGTSSGSGGGGNGKLPLWAERLLALGGGGARPSLANMVGTIHAFVSKNGTGGQFASIGDAQADQVGSTKSILVIFIGQGVYTETLNISRKHVIFIGAGAGKTIITGNRSHGVHKLGTEDTATLSVHGLGFMAQDLTIQNTAGPEGEQAVALMSRSHFSLVYRCSIEGYQDTLNANTGDQLYLETDISGTVDLVFGYARAVFQGCRLLVRSTQYGASIVTAQGRTNRNDSSGFVFQNCSVTAADGANLTGRPWKEHSHVIFMESFHCRLHWLVRVGPIPKTVEYDNHGPGADTSRRIHTPGGGVGILTDCHHAAYYTADSFINASSWMPKEAGRDIYNSLHTRLDPRPGVLTSPSSTNKLSSSRPA